MKLDYLLVLGYTAVIRVTIKYHLALPDPDVRCMNSSSMAKFPFVLARGYFVSAEAFLINVIKHISTIFKSIKDLRGILRNWLSFIT